MVLIEEIRNEFFVFENQTGGHYHIHPLNEADFDEEEVSLLESDDHTILLD